MKAVSALLLFSAYSWCQIGPVGGGGGGGLNGVSVSGTPQANYVPLATNATTAVWSAIPAAGGSVALSPSGDQAILGAHLFNVGTPYASLSAEAKSLVTSFTGELINFAYNSNTVPSTMLVMSDTDATQASTIAFQPICVITAGADSNNQCTASAAYSYGGGTKNYGMLVSYTANQQWDSSGTLTDNIGFYAARPVSPGGATTNATGVHVATIANTNITNGYGIFFEAQPVDANHYVIFASTGNSDFGTSTQEGGTFNARTGFQISGSASTHTFLKGDGTRFTQGSIDYATADIINKPGDGVLLAPSGNQTITGGFTLTNSGGFVGPIGVTGGTASAPPMGFRGFASNVGFYSPAANTLRYVSQNTDIFQFDSTNGVTALNTNGYGWAAGTSTGDLWASRISANVLGVGSSLGDFSGTIKQGNSTFTVAAATVAASQVSIGGTTAAVANCGAVATACLVINVAGTTRYIPYY